MSKWIKPSDRLPKDNTEVLIAKDVFGHQKLDIARFVKSMHKFDEYDFPCKRDNKPGFLKYSDGEYYSISNVLAWMELPEPYKEENNELV